MDSSWLSFSLSNQHPHDSSNLCLFEAFTDNHGTVEGLEDARSGGSLATLAVGAKQESFLGGGSTAALKQESFLGGGSTAALGLFDGPASNGIYDSELKTIAAGFLRGLAAVGEKGPVPAEAAGGRKAAETFGQRTSIYRGVTRHRWTGRYEAHLWDNSCRREGQSRKGRQVYLGGYDKEDKAARAYDLAALKYWGPTTTTNFPISNYEKELEEMKNMTRQEFVASLRRKSSGFSRGASIYRGVTRHHQHGRWQARIGRVAGNKDLYLGTFSTQEEAAEAYDIAAIKFRGLNAVTNFDMSRYDVKSIANSNLPIGSISGKSRPAESLSLDGKNSESTQTDLSMASQPSTLSFAQPIKPDPQDYWSLLALQSPSPQTNAKNKPTLIQSSPNVSGLIHCLSNCNNMDFSTAPSIIQSNGSVLNGGIFQRQNSSCVTVAAPAAATTVAESSFDGSSFGSWATTSIHAFQSGKPNIAGFQTPIFGME